MELYNKLNHKEVYNLHGLAQLTQTFTIVICGFLTVLRSGAKCALCAYLTLDDDQCCY